MVLREKFKNLFFRFLTFCFHGATLKADLRRYACAMNMGDGALEMLDVMLFSRGIAGVVVACFWANGSGFVARLRDKFPMFLCFFFVMPSSDQLSN